MIACPCVNWRDQQESINDLMDIGYRDIPDEYACGSAKRSVVGNFGRSSLPVTAQLIHYGASEAQKSPQWRIGNSEVLGDGVYKFTYGRDLCLSISAECPFPASTFCKSIDCDLEIGKMQNDLRLAGATLYSQLCAMMNNAC
jgi:hypothetical protein